MAPSKDEREKRGGVRPVTKKRPLAGSLICLEVNEDKARLCAWMCSFTRRLTPEITISMPDVVSRLCLSPNRWPPLWWSPRDYLTLVLSLLEIWGRPSFKVVLASLS